MTELSIPMENSSISECIDTKLMDALPHHQCYNWNQSKIECEVEWPCEVRQYLVTISPLIILVRFCLSYGTLFIIISGIFLNILCCYTLISSGLSKKGSGIYLVSLAICDVGNLVANYGVGIARAHVPGFNDIFMESEWTCRWHGVFAVVFQLMSPWIVVGYTVERSIAIWFPILFRHTSRTVRAKKVITWLVISITLLSLLKLLFSGNEGDSVFGYRGCRTNRYPNKAMSFFRVALETWIPASVLFTLNFVMFCKLGKILRKRRRLSALRREVETKSNSIKRPRATGSMLVAVSLAYLILVFPMGVIQSVELFWNLKHRRPEYTIEDQSRREEFIEWKCTKLLLKYLRSLFFAFYQINFCINFFLYFVTGVQFRMYLKNKCKCFIGMCFGRSGVSCEGQDRSQVAMGSMADGSRGWEGSSVTQRSVVMEST